MAVGGPETSDGNMLRSGLFAASAAAFFAAMNLCVKASSASGGPDLPALEVTFFRYLFGLLTASPMLFIFGRSILRTSQAGAHMIRILAGASGVMLMFAALANLPVGLVTSIGFSSPFFTLIFAGLVLGERVGRWRWLAVLVGFFGVMIMTGAPTGAIEPAIGLAVMAAVFLGIEVGVIRLLVQRDHFATILLINNGAALILLSVPAWFVWVTPDPGQVILLAGVGISVVLGQILFLAAMKIGEASFVAPFNYLTLVFAMVFGFLLFAEVPSATTLAGATLIVLAGLFLLHRENIQRRKPSD